MITYFVLKTDEGKGAGCVRLENGRARSSCPCVLLLEDGTVAELGDEEKPLLCRPLGAAVLQGDALLCWGVPPGTKLAKAELLYGLRQGRKAEPEVVPESAPEPERKAEPTPEAKPEADPASEPAPEPEDAPEQESTPESEDVPVPEPVPESALDSETTEEPAPEPEALSAPDLSPEASAPDDSAALAADFGLLVRHAGEVYESILHPPLPTEDGIVTAMKEEAPGKRDDQGDWFSETEQLLERLRR